MPRPTGPPTPDPAGSPEGDGIHPSIQYHLVNTLGWRDLRPLQRASVGPILGGEHVLLLAPTAGGKTEAAVLPLLTRIANERWQPLSSLYLCPLRALLNDVHPRLERYAAFTGSRVGLWHGDVGPAERRRLLADPPDLLLTTPESLEAMLISSVVDAHSFLGHVQAAVVDEVHAFAGDDRGWHLRAVLARLEHLRGAEIQRIGLSATVGNSEGLLEWLTPGTHAAGQVVNPVMSTGDLSTATEVGIDYVGSLTNAATVVARLYPGEKRLVFVESRHGAEHLTQELRGRGVTTFVSHAALSRDERRRAEIAFTEGRDCVIVATSALELGIDVGDLDRVIQIDAPPTVAGFLQRMGRSGRRPGTLRNTLFLCTREQALWTACGLTRLWRAGHVEPVHPPVMPAHLLAHQLLALVLQEGAVGAKLWPEWLGQPFALGDDVALLADAVCDHLTGNGYLAVDDGMLSIGREAEARFGRRHFLELTSVFTAPPLFTVLAGRREVGMVHDLGILAACQAGQRGKGAAVLLLAGRGWRILEVDWRRRRVHVELIDQAGRTRYWGVDRPLRYELTQSIATVLAGDHPGVDLSRRAIAALEDARDSFAGLRLGKATLIRERRDGRAEWWTFAGQRANLELTARIGRLARPGGGVGDLAIPLDDGVDPEQIRAAIDDPTPVDDLLDLAEEVTGGIKFADSIPKWLADSIVLTRLTDPSAVEAVRALGIDRAIVG